MHTLKIKLTRNTAIKVAMQLLNVPAQNNFLLSGYSLPALMVGPNSSACYTGNPSIASP